MKILQINSSVRGKNSESNRIANNLSNKLLSKNAGAELKLLDLAKDPHPALDENTLEALFTPSDKRSPEQSARIALDDALIRDIQNADIVVISAPMYNFGVSVQLKTWFDAISRAGVTFKYGDNGPQGLLTNKKVYVATSRGGSYPETLDPQLNHMRTLLNFLGMDDVTFIASSNQGMSPDLAEKGRHEADAAVASVI